MHDILHKIQNSFPVRNITVKVSDWGLAYCVCMLWMTVEALHIVCRTLPLTFCFDCRDLSFGSLYTLDSASLSGISANASLWVPCFTRLVMYMWRKELLLLQLSRVSVELFQSQSWYNIQNSTFVWSFWAHRIPSLQTDMSLCAHQGPEGEWPHPAFRCNVR